MTDNLIPTGVIGTTSESGPPSSDDHVASEDPVGTPGTPGTPAGGESDGGGGSADFDALASGDDESPTGPRISRTAVEWIVLIVAAIVIAVVIKSFLFQAFYIPSVSMEPTLMVGDRVLVNKLSYDLHDVHRGDIVVFAADPNQQWHKLNIDDLVKRVVAFPGETITQCSGERVCIDGKVLDEPYLPKGTSTIFPTARPKTEAGVNACAPDSPEGGCKVPAGMVFVMGDNRTNSADSRVHGPIKQSSIVGRVFLRIWPLDRIGTL